MVELSDCFLHRTIAQLQDSLGRCIQAHKGNLVVHCFERVNFELVHLCQCLFQIGRYNHPHVAGISHTAQQNDTITRKLLEVQAFATVLAENLGMEAGTCPRAGLFVNNICTHLILCVS